MSLVLVLMRLAAVSMSQVGSTSEQSTLVGAGRKDLSMSIHKRASTGDHSKLKGRRCLRKSVHVVGERLPSSVLHTVRLAWPGYVLVNYAVISVVCSAAQQDPDVVLVQKWP